MIVNAVTSLLVSVMMLVVALSVIPLLFKIVVPGVGDLVWHGYSRLMRWALTAPFRLVALLAREVGRRQPSRGPRGGMR